MGISRGFRKDFERILSRDGLRTMLLAVATLVWRDSLPGVMAAVHMKLLTPGRAEEAEE